MTSIRNNYKDHPFEIQVKAPMLQVALFFISVLSLLIIVSDLVTHTAFSRLIIHAVLVCFILACLALVHKGYYHPVSDIFFMVVTLGFIFLRLLNNPLGDHSLAYFTSIVGAFIVLSSVFIEKIRFLLALVVIYFSSYVALVIRIQTARSWQTDRMPSLEQILFSGIAMITVCISILLIRNVFDKVITANREKMNELEELSIKNKKLISESAEHLGKADRLSAEADTSLEFSNRMQQISAELIDNMNSLNNRLEDSGEALKIVDNAIAELRNISISQSSQVSQSSASIEEMAASIKNVSEIVKDKMHAVEELQRNAADGRSVMEQTHASFENTVSMLDNIKAITGVISGIAAQTNLLAMNAAIEAAHAGDSGRGFAVVADEIRKLSESSSQNAKRIEETVREMSASIENTSTRVNESDKSIQKIAAEIGSFGDSMREISGSTEEMNSGTRGILASVGVLNDVTQKLVEHVQNVAASSGRVNDDLLKIKQISENTGSVSKSSGTESLKLRESSRAMQKLCTELLEQSRKLNSEMQNQAAAE